MRFVHEVASDFTTPNDKVESLVEVMGQVGDPSSQSTLMTLLDHENLVVRRRVAVALGRVGGMGCLSRLEECVSERHTNRRFRELCERAIEQIKRRQRGSSAEAS
jgi:HEAT repeat protein